MKYSNVISAEFASRPNRFIAEVMAGGERVRAHVKNTGRCAELLVPGAKVYVQDHRDSMGSRKLAYSLISVEKYLPDGQDYHRQYGFSGTQQGGQRSAGRRPAEAAWSGQP